MAEPIYTTAEALREKLGVSREVLPDAEAIELIEEAEDEIDDQLGNRPVDEETGRRVTLSDYESESWRLDKLAKATLEVAVALFNDPGVLQRQRYRSVSGDVATSGPYGPALGKRVDTLLNASGLRVPFARADQRRRGRNASIVQSFDEQP